MTCVLLSAQKKWVILLMGVALMTNVSALVPLLIVQRFFPQKEVKRLILNRSDCLRIWGYSGFFSSNYCWGYGNGGGGCGFWWIVGDDGGGRSGVNRSSISFGSIAGGSGFVVASDGLDFGGYGMRCSKWWLEVEVVFVKVW
ncbi:Hypothetical predicted protein [Olea europaea subsp. europaea]|uniref:Uncharacterized protein n=1 Tax=Olea europaea subsp. europaea TaxID=158383 RepID=A0A8S0VLD6_OLEEU|nr:Hypothetical predicted protein [Olea europaea subsp. europaea]